MAGGGVKPGYSHGQTDELGFSVIENPVHVHDLQATILHQLGLDHDSKADNSGSPMSTERCSITF